MEALWPQWICPVSWLIVAVVLVVAEVLTVQMVAIWFAIGSVAAIVPALMGAPYWVQVLVFLAVSAATLVLTRPFLQRVLYVRREHTNADRVIGQMGVVEQTVENDQQPGRVMAMGLSWSALSDDGSAIAVGEKIEVVAIDGVKLIVKRKNASRVEAMKEG